MKKLIIIVILLLAAPTAHASFKAWQPIEISFVGPATHQSASNPNPFLDYRLTVRFIGLQKTYTVPGFYAGRNLWTARFTPDSPGVWTYEAKFVAGSGIAVSSDTGEACYCNGESGSFTADPRDPNASGFYSKGRLSSVPNTSTLSDSRSFYFHTLGDGKPWLKGGTNSPESFLAVDFSPHGGVYGALDYLAEHHVNSAFMILMNLGGDGDNVYPWVSETDFWHYDILKLSRWAAIFDYAMEAGDGIALHFVLNEGEAANKNLLSATGLSTERKLYYREMVARFSYLNAIIWNLCEEYDHHCAGCKLNKDDVRAWADYIKSIDPYDHPITIHNWGTEEQAALEPGVVDGWLPFWGEPRWGAVSYQYRPRENEPSYNDKVVTLRLYAEDARLKIPIGIDETDGFEPYESNECTKPFPDTHPWYTTCGFTAARKELIWPIYLGGGNLEAILGSQPNQKGSPTEPYDFSKWKTVWEYIWYARKFLEDHSIWDLSSRNDLVTDGKTGRELCFANGHDYLVYLPEGGSANLDIETPAPFEVWWYNPRTGQYLTSSDTVEGPCNLTLEAPDSNDWAVSIKEE